MCADKCHFPFVTSDFKEAYGASQKSCLFSLMNLPSSILPTNILHFLLSHETSLLADYLASYFIEKMEATRREPPPPASSRSAALPSPRGCACLSLRPFPPLGHRLPSLGSAPAILFAFLSCCPFLLCPGSPASALSVPKPLLSCKALPRPPRRLWFLPLCSSLQQISAGSVPPCPPPGALPLCHQPSRTFC